jgi:DnaJ-domain-containing protein 1
VARRQRKENGLDLAGIFEKPLRVKRGGKTISMHPYEAELTSLGKRALKGQPRATKLFLKHCEAAGLLDPAPAEQTHGVFVLPKGVNPAIAKVLIETYGLPPWDADAYAALEAEYQRDQALIEERYKEFMKDHENG